MAVARWHSTRSRRLTRCAEIDGSGQCYPLPDLSSAPESATGHQALGLLSLTLGSGPSSYDIAQFTRADQVESEAKDRAAETARRVNAVPQKLDPLDEAFLFAKTIDQPSYERQRDRLREELTFSKIDHHAEALDEMDVEGILAFAERVLPHA